MATARKTPQPAPAADEIEPGGGMLGLAANVLGLAGVLAIFWFYNRKVARALEESWAADRAALTAHLQQIQAQVRAGIYPPQTLAMMEAEAAAMAAGTQQSAAETLKGAPGPEPAAKPAPRPRPAPRRKAPAGAAPVPAPKAPARSKAGKVPPPAANPIQAGAREAAQAATAAEAALPDAPAGEVPGQAALDGTEGLSPAELEARQAALLDGARHLSGGEE